jgi:hypothetical protein
LSTVPVKWLYLGKEIPLGFKSGFICTKQDPEIKTITANMAWFIVLKDQFSTDCNASSILHVIEILIKVLKDYYV